MVALGTVALLSLSDSFLERTQGASEKFMCQGGTDGNGNISFSASMAFDGGSALMFWNATFAS